MLRPWVEPQSIAPPSPFALLHEEELEPPALPREHPKWVRDAVAISQRARRLLAQLKPVAVRIFSFWDHQVRSIAIGGRRIALDPSGGYSIE